MYGIDVLMHLHHDHATFLSFVADAASSVSPIVDVLDMIFFSYRMGIRLAIYPFAGIKV